MTVLEEVVAEKLRTGNGSVGAEDDEQRQEVADDGVKSQLLADNVRQLAVELL